MRKISLKGYLCLKSLAFKQILPTIKITLFLLLFIIFKFTAKITTHNVEC